MVNFTIRFSANSDDRQAVCADLQEVPTSSYFPSKKPFPFLDYAHDAQTSHNAEESWCLVKCKSFGVTAVRKLRWRVRISPWAIIFFNIFRNTLTISCFNSKKRVFDRIYGFMIKGLPFSKIIRLPTKKL